MREPPGGGEIARVEVDLAPRRVRDVVKRAELALEKVLSEQQAAGGTKPG
jgi:hypothetical protein